MYPFENIHILGRARKSEGFEQHSLKDEKDPSFQNSNCMVSIVYLQYSDLATSQVLAKILKSSNLFSSLKNSKAEYKTKCQLLTFLYMSVI